MVFLPLQLTVIKITIYADDIALYKIIRNPRDYTLLQGDITSICNWIVDNHLILNFLKCCYMIFSRKHHPSLPDSPLYVGENHALNKTDHFKYLGVNFSTDLTWSHHINAVCKKTRKQIGLLYRNFYQFSNWLGTRMTFKPLYAVVSTQTLTECCMLGHKKVGVLPHTIHYAY